MPCVTTLLITLQFPLRDSAQARQPPASCFGQLILHLLGTTPPSLLHTDQLPDTHESDNHGASGPRVTV